MELAEAAQREALRELQPRPERRPPSPPGAWMPPSPPAFRDRGLAELFVTLSRCVRQAVLLEARLDAGAEDHPPAARPPAETRERPPAQPRTHEPGDGTAIRHETLEDDSAAYDRRPADEILVEICRHVRQVLAEAPGLHRREAHAPSGRTTPRAGRPACPPHTPAERPPPKPG